MPLTLKKSFQVIKVKDLYIFAFLTTKMDTLNPKTWEKSPNNIEIRPNLTYIVSRGIGNRFGSAEGSVPNCALFLTPVFLIISFLGKFLKLLNKTQGYVPQV